MQVKKDLMQPMMLLEYLSLVQIKFLQDSQLALKDFLDIVPSNEVDRSRSNIALYGDAEFDLSPEFLLSAALRFENYSDFGSTLNWKLASRYLASDNLTVRAALSTGFRAPSLTQIYYNLRFTGFQDGVLTETLLSANNSPVTKGFGIQPLKEEESLNASVGICL